MRDLAAILQEQMADFEMIDHDCSIQTAQEGAEFFGIEVGQTAPTIIVKSENQYYAIITSGDSGRLDLEDLKEILKCVELRLAKPQEIKETTGYTVGTVPLVGHALPTIINRQIKRYSYIYGGTGLSNSTLKISPSDVIRLNHVVAFIS